MKNIKERVITSRSQEVDNLTKDLIKGLEKEGFSVEFGHIGSHTTYALLTHSQEDREIVGYTFIRDMKYYKENVGKLKALQQAIARKQASEEVG